MDYSTPAPRAVAPSAARAPSPGYSPSSAAAPLAFAAVMLAFSPALTACDGSAPGVILGSDTLELSFSDTDTQQTTSFQLTLSATAVESLSAASMGLAVDVVSGGPGIEVSVTRPGGTMATDATPETVTSSGVSYDRYVLTLGDAAPLCPESGPCSLTYGVTITRTSGAGTAFTAVATVSGVITGDVLTSNDVALDFL